MLRGFLFAVKTLCRGKGEVIKMTAQIVAVAIFIIMFGLIIFKDRVVGWIGVTLLFLWIRADLRRK